jgi:small-conductance mechanosensitive channel
MVGSPLTEPITFGVGAYALGSFLVGIVLGVLAWRLVARRCVRSSTLTSWGGDKIVPAALARVLPLWFAVAGAWTTIMILPLRHGVERAAGKFLLAVTVVSVTFAAARIAADVVRLFALRTGGAIRSSSIFVNLTRLAIGLLGLLVLLQSLGLSITPLLTALGVGGLAVALALQDTLSNLFAGIHLVTSKKVEPGDYIKLDSGEEGYVIDVNWRFTSIRELANNVIIVPNSRLGSSIVWNYYRPKPELTVSVDARVAYGADLELVEQVTLEVASEVMREVSGGIPNAEPVVRFNTFAEAGVGFTVVLRAREFSDQFLLSHELVKRLHARYMRERIPIPFIVREISLHRDSHTVSLPSSRRR